VVLTVISVVLVASFLLLNNGQSDSRDVARVAQIKEYQKAFEYYYSDNGRYPAMAGSKSGQLCLGDYADDLCWEWGQSVEESPALTNALVPRYMNKLPEGESILFGDDSGMTYEGMVYRFHDFGSSYSILYFMDGNNEDCRLPGVESQNVGKDTLCTLTIRP